MLVDPDFFSVFVAMTRKFPRLYGDNSALAALNFRLRPSALREMTKTDLAGRILHGSDVPVPVTGAAMWALGMMRWSDWRLTAAMTNPIERDVQLKRALGFPETSFTRLGSLLRRVPSIDHQESPEEFRNQSR